MKDTEKGIGMLSVLFDMAAGDDLKKIGLEEDVEVSEEGRWSWEALSTLTVCDR